MEKTLISAFEQSVHTERKVFYGEDIIAQLPQSVRDISFLDRPSDVRLLVITAVGERAAFSNHGHPDNEQSIVDFNGENGVMIMPAGNGPFEQIKNAEKIIDTLQGRKITIDFILKHITTGDLRSAAKEIYGPVTGREGVEQQTSRFIKSKVLAPDGSVSEIEPDIQDNYVMGMRSPTREEIYRIDFETRMPATIIGAEHKESSDYLAMKNVVSQRPLFLKGKNTAAEMLDTTSVVLEDEIYLVVDSGSGMTKPIRKSVAESIFDTRKATTLNIDSEGVVLSITRPLSALQAITKAELGVEPS